MFSQYRVSSTFLSFLQSVVLGFTVLFAVSCASSAVQDKATMDYYNGVRKYKNNASYQDVNYYLTPYNSYTGFNFSFSIESGNELSPQNAVQYLSTALHNYNYCFRGFEVLSMSDKTSDDSKNVKIIWGRCV